MLPPSNQSVACDQPSTDRVVSPTTPGPAALGQKLDSSGFSDIGPLKSKNVAKITFSVLASKLFMLRSSLEINLNPLRLAETWRRLRRLSALSLLPLPNTIPPGLVRVVAGAVVAASPMQNRNGWPWASPGLRLVLNNQNQSFHKKALFSDQIMPMSHVINPSLCTLCDDEACWRSSLLLLGTV